MNGKHRSLFYSDSIFTPTLYFPLPPLQSHFKGSSRGPCHTNSEKVMPSLYFYSFQFSFLTESRKLLKASLRAHTFLLYRSCQFLRRRHFVLGGHLVLAPERRKEREMWKERKREHLLEPSVDEVSWKKTKTVPLPPPPVSGRILPIH